MTQKTPNIYEGNHPTVNVALCQVQTVPWQIEANLQRLLESLRVAAEHDAHLAVTPECVLHGSAHPKDPDYMNRILSSAQPIDSPIMERLRQAAVQHQMALVVGLALHEADGRISNGTVTIDPEGTLLGAYRKVHCPRFESVNGDGVFSPGSEFHVHPIELNGVAFGLGVMIGLDRQIPEAARCLRALGADLIACPLATDTVDTARRRPYADGELVTRCRAAENEVFVAVVNHAGRFNGGSFLAGPSGECLHQMGTVPGVHLLHLPLEPVRTRFHAEPFGWMGWGYRRPEVYRKYLGRLATGEAPCE